MFHLNVDTLKLPVKKDVPVEKIEPAPEPVVTFWDYLKKLLWFQ